LAGEAAARPEGRQGADRGALTVFERGALARGSRYFIFLGIGLYIVYRLEKTVVKKAADRKGRRSREN
jgi:hypothetical protein